MRKVILKADAAPETVPRDDRQIDGFSPFAGASVLNLSPAVAQELGMPTSATGVVIYKVERGSQAARLGIVVEISCAKSMARQCSQPRCWIPCLSRISVFGVLRLNGMAI